MKIFKSKMMKTKVNLLLLLLAVMIGASTLNANELDSPPSSGMVTISFENPVVRIDSTFVIPDVSPEYPGGSSSLLLHLQSNIRYPLKARTEKIQGTVFVKYFVEPTGEISNVSIFRSVSPELDEEAMRVVQLMPQWKPGYKDGAPVRVQFYLPVRFVM
jgi:TonB family protein